MKPARPHNLYEFRNLIKHATWRKKEGFLNKERNNLWLAGEIKLKAEFNKRDERN